MDHTIAFLHPWTPTPMSVMRWRYSFDQKITRSTGTAIIGGSTWLYRFKSLVIYKKHHESHAPWTLVGPSYTLPSHCPQHLRRMHHAQAQGVPMGCSSYILLHIFHIAAVLTAIKPLRNPFIAIHRCDHIAQGQHTIDHPNSR